MFGQEGELALKYEILKENHETLERDYKSCQEMIKLQEDTYELIKAQLQTANKELQVTNARLFEECEKERAEKDKYKKLFEEANVALMVKKEKLSFVNRKNEGDLEKMEDKYVELTDKFGVAETELAFVKAMYEAEVAASGTLSAVMSEIGDTENEVNHNVDNDVTEDMEISDAERNQEEDCKTEAKSVNENQATREVSVNHPPPFSASPSSSSASPSSSSSSDRFEDVFKPSADWPDWALPQSSKEKSKKP